MEDEGIGIYETINGETYRICSSFDESDKHLTIRLLGPMSRTGGCPREGKYKYDYGPFEMNNIKEILDNFKKNSYEDLKEKLKQDIGKGNLTFN